jgi:voltage-gated sodium channel
MLAPSSASSPLIRLLESPLLQRLIIGLILLNAVTLGLETSAAVMAAYGPWIKAVDRSILVLFTLEVGAKLIAYRGRFWREPWNLFDFAIVAVAWLPASGPFTVLRVLRLLRLVSLVPKLRFIVEALLRAIPGIVSIFGLLLLVFYVFAVMATGLFGETHPQWFGSLGASLYTLFQVMTLESWSMGIARPVIEAHPHAWVFFIVFILVSTFTVLNLFIAIIVDAMQRIGGEQGDKTEAVVKAVVHEEQAHWQAEFAALHAETVALQQRLLRLQQMLEAGASRSAGKGV